VLRTLVATALAAALAVVVAAAGPGEAQPPADCEAHIWDRHEGRVALYTMFPKGALRRRDGSEDRSFAYRYRYRTIETTEGSMEAPVVDPENNTYVDEAGVEWILVPDDESAFHQPEGVLAAVFLGRKPYKKFVAPDGTGGSFEAVLAPDDLEAERPVYGRNWVRDDRKTIGTYNYSDNGASTWGHIADDVLPHWWSGDYHMSPRFEIDPEKVPGWRTYRRRAEELIGRFLAGAPRELGGRQAGPKARLVSTPEGLAVVADRPGRTGLPREHPVDPDLEQLARHLAGCLGEDETRAPAEGEDAPDADRGTDTDPQEPEPPDETAPDAGEEAPPGDDAIGRGECIIEIRRRGSYATHVERYLVFHLQEPERAIGCDDAKALFLDYMRRRLREGRGDLRRVTIGPWICTIGSRSIRSVCNDGEGTILAIRDFEGD
jgi:hypothetical protein